MSHPKRLGFVAAIMLLLVTLCALAIYSLRVPAGSTVIQELGTNYHQNTQWIIDPSYATDALCFFNYVTRDRYYLDLFGADVRGEIAHLTQAATEPERKACARLYKLRRGPVVTFQ